MENTVVRTITCSLSLERSWSYEDIDNELQKAKVFLEEARRELETKVKLVQTVRLSCNPVEEWCDLDEKDAALEKLKHLAECAKLAGIEFISLGPVKEKRHFGIITEVLRLDPHLNISATLDGPFDHSGATDLAQIIKECANVGSGASGCFRFCLSANVRPSTPFFPASYFNKDLNSLHFSIGLETSELLLGAFRKSLSECGVEKRSDLLKTCQENLIGAYKVLMKGLSETCSSLAERANAVFDGIDASMNPSLSDDGIGTAFSEVLACLREDSACTFGRAGTLTLSYLVTTSIRTAGEESGTLLCGYSGLMLPQMEDHGIAGAADEGAFSVQDLLLYSAVCGVGIDTVPIPASTCVNKLALVLLDVCSLSTRWSKPLSCRFILLHGKEAGEKAEIPENPYLCTSTVLGIN